MMKKKWLVLVLILTISTVSVLATYIPNSRDTKQAPEKIVYTIEQPEEQYMLFDNDYFTFYFRDELDVLFIYDKTADFTYKTGLDVPFDDDVEDACEELLDTEGYTVTNLEDTCTPLEDLSSSGKAYGNSFLVLEYLEEIDGRIDTLYSADDDFTSELSQVEGDGSHWVLDIDYDDFDTEVRVHMYFTDQGVEYEIRDSEIVSESREKILSISVTPFMGAQGGYKEYFNTETLEYDIVTENGLNPGYSFVPDGSGALIRYEDTNIEVDEYHATVYGGDLTRAYSYNEVELEYIEPSDATLPVFGMSYGDDTEVAFVAYATSGDEYMEIVSVPLSSKLHYVQTYSKYIYNAKYNQIYSEDQPGYSTLSDTVNNFDLYIHYDFLNGDGSSNTYQASYVGMALTYRDYLLDEGLISLTDSSYQDIPVRIDFLMADSKTGIFGYEEQVSTTADNVSDILNQIYSNGVMNVNSGLLGWQEGGMILTSPKDLDFSSSIGTKREFSNLFEEMTALGYDVSFVNDYAYINEDMETLRGNAVKHINGLYYTRTLTNYQTISELTLVKTTVAAEWLNDHAEEFKDMGQTSITIDGITNNLYGAPTDDLTALDSITLLQETFDSINEDLVINAYNPNVYLMSSVDRYLNMPVYSSQYILASDTVPFIELVFQGTVEMYAPYANFSFSSANDVLRMIDYNLYPSFVLTEEPSYVLASTNSNEFISTQFSDYEDLITSIYNDINDALGSVDGATWESRIVLADGLVLNEYSNDVKIVINYTNQSMVYNGNTVGANDYIVIED